MRGIFEWLGCTVRFWPQNGTIEARGNGRVVDLYLGNPRARVDDRIVTLSTPPREINGSTFVPLRFVATAMGATVQWSETTKTATVRYNQRMGLLRLGQKGIRTISCN